MFFFDAKNLQQHCIAIFTIFAKFMKFVAIILASLNVLLTALPCDDVNTFNVSQIEFNANHSDNDTESDFDFCTPFCSCNCCSTIVISPNSNQYTSIIEIPFPVLNSRYNALFSSNALSGLFQPPQV